VVGGLQCHGPGKSRQRRTGRGTGQDRTGKRAFPRAIIRAFPSPDVPRRAFHNCGACAYSLRSLVVESIKPASGSPRDTESARSSALYHMGLLLAHNTHTHALSFSVCLSFFQPTSRLVSSRLVSPRLVGRPSTNLTPWKAKAIAQTRARPQLNHASPSRPPRARPGTRGLAIRGPAGAMPSPRRFFPHLSIKLSPPPQSDAT
jgi:hypothetical protein